MYINRVAWSDPANPANRQEYIGHLDGIGVTAIIGK
jgi:hypothetical protein